MITLSPDHLPFDIEVENGSDLRVAIIALNELFPKSPYLVQGCDAPSEIKIPDWALLGEQLIYDKPPYVANPDMKIDPAPTALNTSPEICERLGRVCFGSSALNAIDNDAANECQPKFTSPPDWPPRGTFRASHLLNVAASEFYCADGEDVRTGRRYFSLNAAMKVMLPNLTSEELDQSEVYRIQMAAICTAALGWYNGNAISEEYKTPALKDVLELRKKYWTALDEIKSLKEANNTFARNAIKSDEASPLEELANHIEFTDSAAQYREVEELRARVLNLSKDREEIYQHSQHAMHACAELQKLAERHGWAFQPGGLSALGQISDWLDVFVKVSNEQTKLNQLNIEANTTIDHLRNQLNGAQTRINELVAAEAGARADQITIEQAYEKLEKKYKSAQRKIARLSGG